MKRQGTRFTVDILFVLTLFCVLAFCAISVVIIGARIYRGLVARMDDNFSNCASLNYVANKIRQNDVEGAVYLSEVEGVTALVIERSYNLTSFTTWIYHDGGYIREIMLRKDEGIRLEDGMPIIQTTDFLIEQQSDGLFKFSTRDSDGVEVSILVGVRCSGVPEQYAVIV